MGDLGLVHRQLTVRNPRTGADDFSIVPASGADLDRIVARARHAQPAWEAAGLDGRIAALARWRDAVAAARDDLIAAVSVDTGRRAESLREADNIGKWIDRWSNAARQALAPRMTQTSNPAFQATSGFMAIPVLGVISPWNFPMSLSLMDAIPALLAGCAVVIKPSEVTPRFVAPLVRTLADIPELAGIVTYVQGDGATGAALVDRVDGICFTGSTATGRKVAAQAGARLIPCFVELGGKDAAIVLEGSDIERATSAILTGATLGTGQQCYSIERIYVARPLHDAFVTRLVEKARKLRLAHPDPTDGQIGPLIFAPQAEIIHAQLRDARAKGAQVHCGGAIETHGGGLWIAPTVLTGVTHDMAVMRDETFGPLMPVMAFDGAEQAVALANDSIYGLSGAVFGPRAMAMQVAARMRAGAVCVNDAGATPFFIGDTSVCGSDAFGCSGLGGTRRGPDSILRFVRRKLMLDNTDTAPSPWWYPV